MKTCPRCKSDNVKVVDYMDFQCIICSDCGFDERETYEVYPEQKTSQKEKGRYTPYKQGGSFRNKK
jgi:hypothetical protein